MIELFMILTEAGIPIFFQSYTNLEINHILLSGFLSAIDELAETSMKSGLKQVQLEDRYITIKRQALSQGEKVRFILIHQHCLGFSQQEDCICVPSTIQKISSEFLSRFIDSKFEGEDLMVRNLEGLEEFHDFEDYVDSIIENHFRNHAILCNFGTDTELPNLVEKPHPMLFGFISFLNDKLFKFHLGPTFSNLKYPKLIKFVELWGELVSTDTSDTNFTILEFKDFKIATSIRMSNELAKTSIFTFWDPEMSQEAIQIQHTQLCDILVL